MPDAPTPMTPAERFAVPVSGGSYRWPAKAIAVTITAGTMLFLLVGLFNGAMADPGFLLLFAGAGFAMGMGCYYIVTGKTTVDSRGIHQQWIFPKFYPWEEIYKVRLVRLPLATRLVLTTPRPPFKAVHAGTPELIAAFEEVARLVRPRPRA
ncbi:MAG: hypothetical protein R3E68_04000 [Burkholderiaceae bacterium]